MAPWITWLTDFDDKLVCGAVSAETIVHFMHWLGCLSVLLCYWFPVGTVSSPWVVSLIASRDCFLIRGRKKLYFAQHLVLVQVDITDKIFFFNQASHQIDFLLLRIQDPWSFGLHTKHARKIHPSGWLTPSFILSITHPFNRYVWKTSFMPGIILSKQ